MITLTFRCSSIIHPCWSFGQQDGEADDHLHVDIGYTVFEPVAPQDSASPTEES